MTNINKFYGGMSDDAYFGANGQYQYSEGLDVRRFPRYVQLQRENTLKYTTTALPLSFLEHINSVGNYEIYGCDSTGKIYGPTGTNVATTATTRPIFDTAEMGLYAYFFQDTKISYVLKSNIVPASAWTGLSDMVAAPVDTDKRSAVVFNDTLIYFANGNTLGKIESATPTTFTNITTFEADSEIAGITLHGDLLWVYSKRGTKYGVNTGGNEQIQVIKNYQENIRFIYDNNDNDYVFGGVNEAYSSMYLDAGFGPNSQQVIKRATDISNLSGFVTESRAFTFGNDSNEGNTNTFAENKDSVFIPNKGSTVQLCSYGKKGNGFPRSMVVDYNLASNGNAFSLIGGLHAKDSALLIGWQESTSFGVDQVDLNVSFSTTYLAIGKIALLKDDGGDIGEIKNLKEGITISADIPSGTTIVVKYRLDGGGVETYKTIASTDLVKQQARFYDNVSANFGEIQWFLELNSDVGQTATPKLYNFSYEPELVGAK